MINEEIKSIITDVCETLENQNFKLTCFTSFEGKRCYCVDDIEKEFIAARNKLIADLKSIINEDISDEECLAACFSKMLISRGLTYKEHDVALNTYLKALDLEGRIALNKYTIAKVAHAFKKLKKENNKLSEHLEKIKEDYYD